MQPKRNRYSEVSVPPIVAAYVAPDATAQDSPLAEWKFRAILYGWFPTVSGEASYASSGGATLDLNADDYLDNLRFVFMGTLEARRGRWGAFSDYIYLDFDSEEGATRNFTLRGPLGGISVPGLNEVQLGLRHCNLRFRHDRARS